jgi:hypothetical protein
MAIRPLSLQWALFFISTEMSLLPDDPGRGHIVAAQKILNPTHFVNFIHDFCVDWCKIFPKLYMM